MKAPIVLSLLLLLLSITGCSSLESPSTALSEQEIQVVLQTQVDEWNRGDIPAFMETYVKTDQLRFASGGTAQRGWQTTLERYQTRYPTPEAMGRLAFEELEVQILSTEWAEVHGRYRLYREGDYDNATGLFTLLMQNTPNGWKILHDHTSAATN
ncbi:MAG: YybH family protein [Verrucomicrobiia bacterium]|jgi:ketosteroid isomerase-like protein